MKISIVMVCLTVSITAVKAQVTFAVSPTVINEGETVTLTCTKPGFSTESMDIRKGTDLIYSCILGNSLCDDEISEADYTIVDWSVTDGGSFEIRNAQSNRDGGSWTCTIGGSDTSDPVSVSFTTTTTSTTTTAPPDIPIPVWVWVIVALGSALVIGGWICVPVVLFALKHQPWSNGNNKPVWIFVAFVPLGGYAYPVHYFMYKGGEGGGHEGGTSSDDKHVPLKPTAENSSKKPLPSIQSTNETKPSTQARLEKNTTLAPLPPRTAQAGADASFTPRKLPPTPDDAAQLSPGEVLVENEEQKKAKKSKKKKRKQKLNQVSDGEETGRAEGSDGTS